MHATTSWMPSARMRCPECFVEEGALHVEGCLQEECPVCGGQLEDCGCDFIRKQDGTLRVRYVEESDLEPAARLPYLFFPRICARCGKMHPHIFIVSDEEWEKYVPPSVSKKHLCHKCYNEIKGLQDGPV